MIQALLDICQGGWRPRLEVPVYRPVRGSIDLVLENLADAWIVACEAQSELRRIEQQVRWFRAKADALAASREGEAEGRPTRGVERLLLLRSAQRTRAVAAQYSDLLAAAYPARAQDAYEALTASAPWPGDALLWCRVEGGRAEILERPPRGIRVGR